MKRKENESFEDYKERRRAENLRIKRRLKGRWVWDSLSNGTYRKGKNDHR